MQEAINNARMAYKGLDSVNLTDTELLGDLIARHFRWDIFQISEVFINALTEANAHDMARKIQSILESE